MATTHSFGVKDAVGEVADKVGGGGRKSPPPDGAYKLQLTQLTLGPNRNNDMMLTAILEVRIPESNKKLAKHDGYWVYHRMNLTDQGKSFVNHFLNALAGDEKKGLKLQKDLWENDKLTTKDEDLPSDVTKIGAFVIGSPDGKKMVAANLVGRTYTRTNKNTDEEEDVDTVDVTSFMPATATLRKGSDDDEEDDGADEGDDDLIEEDDLGEEDEDDLEEDGEEESEDDEEAERREELEELDLKSLRKLARDDHDIAASETKGKTEEEVIEMILEAEFGAEEEEEEGEEEEDEDDLDDELEPEPEPEPVKKKPAAKKAAVKKAAPVRRGAKAKASDEPPF